MVPHGDDPAPGAAAPSSSAGRPWSPDVGGGPLWARTWAVSVSAYPPPDVLQLMVEEVGPQVVGQPGFSGATVLVDRATGELRTTTFWDSLEALGASTRMSGNASAAWAAMGASSSPRETRVCDVLAALPVPVVSDPHLPVPGSEEAEERDRTRREPPVREPGSWWHGAGGGPVWARSWRLKVPSYPPLDSQALVVEEVLPRIAALPGFLGGHVLVDRAGGDVLTTTCWASLGELERGTALAAQAGSAAEVLSGGGSVQDLRVLDVLALQPIPVVSHPFLRPPDEGGRA